MTESQPSAPGGSTRDRIAEIVAEYESAFNRNDAKAMNDLFAADAIFVNFGADLLYRAQAHVFAPGGVLEDVTVGYHIESIVFLTPEVAVVHARQRGADPDGRLATGGDPMEGILQMSLMPDPQGRWRIHVAQNTPVTAPPMAPDGSH